MVYGWTIDHVLNMPAVHFFLFLKHAVETKQRDFNRLLFELCDIVAISVCKDAGDYHRDLKNVYRERLSDKPPTKGRVLDAADPKSAQILASLLGQRKF
jgi:hypothetical protein